MSKRWHNLVFYKDEGGYGVCGGGADLCDLEDMRFETRDEMEREIFKHLAKEQKMSYEYYQRLMDSIGKLEVYNETMD